MDAADLKSMLGERAKYIIANGLGFKSKMVKCPLHDDDKPSMSWFADGLMYRCHACKGQIDIYKYYQDYEGMTFIEAKDKVAELVGVDKGNRITKKERVLPSIKTRELSQKAIDYMALRKINKETLDHWQVKETTWGGKDVYVFQYFNNGVLEYVSYRGIGKGEIKGGCEKDTEPILWGMWHIDKAAPVVITEGQPDAMAVWQSGYKNVISVPNGANNFKWIDTCWNWLKDINEFIVFADNDKPGLKFADEVKTKLNNVKVVYSENHKDANEVLFYEGPEKVMKIIKDGIGNDIEGLIDVSEMEYEPISDIQGIETGFIEYDRHVEDWKPEELTVIFGRNNEGKTTFVSQVIAHCLEKKVNVFLYSGEMSDRKIQDWLYRQLIGNKREYYEEVKTKYRTKWQIKESIIKVIKEWHKGRLHIVDRKAEKVVKDMDKFFNLMEIAAKRKGVKLFVIDNLMSWLEENADSLYSDQANLVQRSKEFAITNKVHVVLLAHPNKEKKELKGNVGNLEKTDISGSNNIPNKTDNIIAVERLWAEDRECDALVTSLKDRESGDRLVMKFNFSKKTLRFYNDSTVENVSYSWECINTVNDFDEVERPEGCPF